MKDTITYDDFAKLDIRVGQIVAATVPEWSEKLIELNVNFGEEIGERTILAGVKAWYDAEFFQDKKGIFIVNLAPRKMGPSESQGMMLMCDTSDKPEPIFVPDSTPLGVMVR